MCFEGFSAEGLAMLADLPNHDKQWFGEHKPLYTTLLLEPAKAFAAAMTDGLRDDVSPGIEGQPKVNGSISPINNDLRFSPDKAPYKDHLMFKWWEGAQKKTAPTLWVRMSSTDVGLATGTVLTPDGLERWRAAVDDETSGAVLASAVADLVGRCNAEVVGAELKRVPRPYDADHPRGDLLRHKWLQIRWLRPLPEEVRTAAFVDWCSDQLTAATDVHRWLVDHL
ncbi:MAG: DUF2461 domain-containing protein [Acidimicrobiia bacterium]|nr:DUF2461 domain-containing protein [Acidimicrobiia bacterium]